MKTKDYSVTYVVNQPVEEIFATLLDVRQWWSGLYGEEIEGASNKLGDEFIFTAGGGMHYSKQKLVELVSNKKIVWLVTDSKLTFASTVNEWTGTKICFDFTAKGSQTEVTFTHIGLVPQLECFEGCSAGWNGYLQKFLAPLQAAVCCFVKASTIDTIN